MSIIRGRALGIILAACATVAATGATPAAAIPPDVPPQAHRADCSGRMGNSGMHRLVGKRANLRAYNNTQGQIIATLNPGKRLHLFYTYPDNHGTWLWATRAYVGGTFICGFIYPDRVKWNTNW